MNKQSLAIRFSIYIIVVLYVLADVYWFNGPLRQTVESIQPGSDAESQKVRQSKVAAIIFGEGITLAQLDMRVLRHLYRKGTNIDDCSPERLYQLRLILLQELMLERVVEGKLRARPEIKLSAEIIAASVAEVKNQYNTPAQAMTVIKSAGLTEKKLTEHYAQWIEQLVYVDRIVAGNEDRMPVEDHIEAYFNKHQDAFILPERYHLRHLFLTTLHKDPVQVGEQISAIHLKIASGQTSFVQMVTDHSDDPATQASGGDLGWLALDRLPGAIPTEGIAALQPGEVSDPIQSRIGWHLFDLIEKRPARKLELQEVRGMIREHLAHQQRVRYANALKRVMENDAEARVVFESLTEPFSFAKDEQ